MNDPLPLYRRRWADQTWTIVRMHVLPGRVDLSPTVSQIWTRTNAIAAQ